MNTESTPSPNVAEAHSVETGADNVVALASHERYRSREVGVGYGRSSGYGLDRRYTSDWGAERFRCA